jgi:hypothetical protein
MPTHIIIENPTFSIGSFCLLKCLETYRSPSCQFHQKSKQKTLSIQFHATSSRLYHVLWYIELYLLISVILRTQDHMSQPWQCRRFLIPLLLVFLSADVDHQYDILELYSKITK